MICNQSNHTMIPSKNPELILLLMDLFQDSGIECITLNGSFSMIYDKSQNLEILRYIIVDNIGVELRDPLLFDSS